MIESISSLYGYIDPVTGSLVIQVVIAMFLSVGVIFRRALIAPIIMFCGKNRCRNAVSDRSAQDQEEDD